MDKQKTYYIKIQADGINHIQILSDKEDLEILLAVLKKIERNVSKIISNNGQ